ncbi:MAG TPA: DUF2127 domain-containing protein [Pyrinomonadaceae bacterium]
MSSAHIRYKKQTPRQRTLTIHLIALEKVTKATILIVAGLKLLSLVGHDVHVWAMEFINRHGIDLANRYVQMALDRLTGVDDSQLIRFGIAAFAYAAVLLVEGIGLWMQYRWAEYMTVISTALFIPFELYEIFERFTFIRVGILAINIFVVWYLSTRIRDEHVEIVGATVA